MSGIFYFCAFICFFVLVFIGGSADAMIRHMSWNYHASSEEINTAKKQIVIITIISIIFLFIFLYLGGICKI
jgi:hypothetical protein